MDIRKAAISDLYSLTELFNQYRVFYKKEPDLAATLSFVSERINKGDSEIFGAFIDDKMAGFMQLYPLFSSTRMKKLWILNDLFVDEDYRGRRMSVALVEHAKKFCKQSGACGFMLETEKTNLIGNRLYETLNLRLDAAHNYYQWDAE